MAAVLGAAVLAASACAPLHSRAAPAWCEPSTQSSATMTACASGASEREADEAAMAQLARQLSQDLRVEQTMVRAERSAQAVGKPQKATASAADSLAVTGTSLSRLYGARIDERAHDGGRFYARAILDMHVIASRVAGELGDADESAADGDFAAAFRHCGAAIESARLLPPLFATGERPAAICAALRDRIYARTAIQVAGSRALQVVYAGHPVAGINVVMRRGSRERTDVLIAQTDDAGRITLEAARAPVGGGVLEESFDIAWDRVDAALGARLFQPRATVVTQFAPRAVSLDVTGALTAAEREQLRVALLREFGNAVRSQPGVEREPALAVTVRAELRNDAPLYTGDHAAGGTVSWEAVSREEPGSHWAGGRGDIRGSGFDQSRARATVLARMAADIASEMERALATSTRE